MAKMADFSLYIYFPYNLVKNISMEEAKEEEEVVAWKKFGVVGWRV